VKGRLYLKIISPYKGSHYVLTVLTVVIFGVLAIALHSIIPLSPETLWGFIPYHKIMRFASVLCIVLGIFISCVYLPLWFAHLRYSFSDTHIVKRSGAFYIKEQTVSFKSIQYTETVSLPFIKIAGLRYIVLNVFGGKMILFFLKEKDYREIVFLIINNQEQRQ